MARAIKQPISACPAMNALRGKRIVAPPRAQRMPIIMGPTRKDAGRANRSSTRARISDAPTAAAHCRAGRINPKVHLLPSRSCRARGFEAPVDPSLLGVLCDPGLSCLQPLQMGPSLISIQRKVLKCGPTVGQLLNDLIEARRRKGKVGGPRSARQKLRRPKDQMDGTTRAKSEPADIRACGLFLDLRKPEDLRVEPGARVQVAHEQRDVVQFQGGRHSCTSKAC